MMTRAVREPRVTCDARSRHLTARLLASMPGATPSGQPRGLQGWMALLLLLTVPALVALSKPAAAQTTPAIPGAAASAGKSASPAAPRSPSASRPTWSELTPMQQQALKPLAASWNTIMSEQQKRKWLQISNNYPSLSPAEQATLHGRMNEWVLLSPQQRAQARLNFGKTQELSKQLTPEEKKAQWQTYQALSPEEKQKLAAKASPKPAGAATAVKPVSPQKLAAVPPHPVPKPGSKPAVKNGDASGGATSMPIKPAPAPGPVAPPTGGDASAAPSR